MICANAWDSFACQRHLVLNGYLILNPSAPAYIRFCHQHNREPDTRKYRSFVVLPIFWAFGIHPHHEHRA